VALDEATIDAVLRGDGADMKKRILDAYREAARGNDVTIATSMGDLSCGLALGYSMEEFVAARRYRPRYDGLRLSSLAVAWLGHRGLPCWRWGSKMPLAERRRVCLHVGATGSRS
jgi:hypothetical protein